MKLIAQISFVLFFISVSPLFTGQLSSQQELFIHQTLKKAQVLDYETLPIVVDNNYRTGAAVTVDRKLIVNLKQPSYESLKEQENCILHEGGHLYYNHTGKQIRYWLASNTLLIGGSLFARSRYKTSMPHIIGLFILNELHHKLTRKIWNEVEADRHAIIHQGTAKYALSHSKYYLSKADAKEAFDKKIRVESNNKETYETFVARQDPTERKNFEEYVEARRKKQNYDLRKPQTFVELLQKTSGYISYAWKTGHAPLWWEHERIIAYAKKHNIPLDKE